MPRFINTATGLLAALPELNGAELIALDTEFHTERWYYPRLMLLQLRADGRDPLLVDPLAVSIAALAGPLSTRPVVVHGGQQDAQILFRMLGVVPNIVFDTQIAAGFAGAGYPVRLQELVRRFLGAHMPKGETLSDWSRRPLSPAQLGYAADDVLVLHDLKAALDVELQRSGLGGAVAEATREMAEAAARAPDDSQGWTRVGGAHTLDAEERACLQALVAWRDRESRDRDVQKNALASDAVLLDLARRRPGSAQDMRANRRMPGHLSRQEAEVILELLAHPGPPPEPLTRDRGMVDVVRAATRVVERRTGVAAELLLPDAEIHSLLAGKPVRPWRAALLGDEFSSFVRGESGFCIPAGFLDQTIS